MRNLNRNMRVFWYSLLESTSTVVESGYDTGEPIATYAEPVCTKGNISPARGGTQQEQFGMGVEYDKVIQLQGTDWPIDESTLLWIDKSPVSSNDSADMGDYAVVRVAKSLNQTAIAVRRVGNG